MAVDGAIVGGIRGDATNLDRRGGRVTINGSPSGTCPVVQEITLEDDSVALLAVDASTVLGGRITAERAFCNQRIVRQAVDTRSAGCLIVRDVTLLDGDGILSHDSDAAAVVLRDRVAADDTIAEGDRGWLLQ